MNKKILMLLVSVLAIAMLAIPVIAEPTKGQKVPARFRVIPPPDVTDAGYSWFTKSGVFHGRGHTETYSAKLNISGTVYNAFLVTVHKVGMWNPKQRTMATHSEDIVYIPSEGSSNGFSGMGVLKLYGWDWTTQMWTSQKIYHVWHGFGSFEGQTLLLSYEGPISSIVTGYCLKG
jgi:hypothetical protein